MYLQYLRFAASDSQALFGGERPGGAAGGIGSAGPACTGSGGIALGSAVIIFTPSTAHG